MQIFLTDSQKNINYQDYPTDNALQFIVRMKKVFPSVFDLMIPILAEGEDIQALTWESTESKFKQFQQLVQEWVTLELRLDILAKKSSSQEVQNILKAANTARVEFSSQQEPLYLLHGDFVFLHTIHTLIDMALLAIGENFYVDQLKKRWQADIPSEILNRKVTI